MTGLRVITVSIAALLLASCAEGADPSAPPPEAAEPAGAGPSAAEPVTEEGGLHPLEIAAQNVCAAGDEGFAQALPDGSAFASRGPDARVHVAWNVDGERYEAIIDTPALDADARLAFDGAVADFMRRNMQAGVDRTGLTGAFRYRDGRFCVVQTEAEAIGPFKDAVRAAETGIAAGAPD